MQPLDKEQLEKIGNILGRWQGRPGPLLEILHEVQGAFGFIPEAAIEPIASGLNLSRAEVHGVVTFYHYFREHPAGRHTLEICRAEACQSMHSEVLIEHAKKRLGVDFHGTTADGKLSLLPVYCLGNCACSPAVMIDGELHGRVSPQKLDELLTELT